MIELESSFEKKAIERKYADVRDQLMTRVEHAVEQIGLFKDYFEYLILMYLNLLLKPK